MPDLPQIGAIDDGFVGVISRIDPALVPASYVSNAVNRRFEDNVIKNRWGIVQPKWGGKWEYLSKVVTVTSGSSSVVPVSGAQIPQGSVIICDPVANVLVFKNGTRCILDDGTNVSMSTAAVTFTGSPVNRTVRFYNQTLPFTDILGVMNYRDPDTGVNAMIVATNEVRTSTDGGQGKVYCIRPNQSPLEIPLNGHDIYQSVRLIQATNGVVMLRPGNARYYFTGADVNAGAGTVTLKVTPDLQSGDRVVVYQIGSAPNLWISSTASGQGFGMYVNVKAGGVCTLHLSQTNAQQGTNPVTLKSGLTSSDRYYLELSNNTTGYDVTEGISDFYNDGLPLLMEASFSSGSPVSALDNGFNRIASVNSIVASSDASDTITVPNHPFVAGDQVTLSNVLNGGTTVTDKVYYVYPADKNSLKLFSGPTEETDSLNNAERALITATIGRTTATATLSINFLGAIVGVNITNAGAGYTTATATVNPNGGGGSGASITPIVTNGKITGFTISSGGSGYTPGVATITISTPTTDGVLTASVVNQGSGYLTAPALTITGGAGASITTAIQDGKVTSVTVVDPGNYYSFATVAAAMPSTMVDIPANNITGTIKKSSASGASVPAGREGLYFQNRLLLLYGPDYLAVSDVLDPLHYSPILNEFKLNTGANDAVVALYPFNATTLIVFKERSILAIENLYGDLSTTRLTEVTREFGCVSQNSIASTGSDIVFLSQRGVISLKQTEFGISQSVVLPLSDQIQNIIDEIDQANWSGACATYFANRYIISVPVEGGNGKNQRTLVYNFLNKAWEGYWEGSMLVPRYWCRLVVAGTDTLCWADESGLIHQFDPQGLVDVDRFGALTQVSTEVKFRGYTGEDNVDHKQWTDLQLELGNWNTRYSLSAVLDGVSESYVVATNQTKDRTVYYTYGSGTYNTNNTADNFLAPFREDYSVTTQFRCGNNGWKAGLHQFFTHKARLRRHSASVQPLLTTDQGSLEVYSSKVIGIAFRLYGKNDV